ncbi:MAG: serine/threonine-protein kinase [Planctomycetota bacterium]
MTDASTGSNPLVEALAEQYLARRQRGELVDIEEYCEAHPDLATEIRSLFSTLEMMEVLASQWSRDEGAMPPPPPDAPSRVGGYRILRQIGRGGMGVVYEAEQESLGRRVALKVLSKGKLGGGSSARRFQQEARAAARLHHTNIIPVFEVGEEGEYLFFAMQLIAGASLDRVIQELAAATGDATSRAAQTIPGLQEARSIARSLLRDHFRVKLAEASSVTGSAGARIRETSGADDSTGWTARSDRGESGSHVFFQHAVARLARQVAQALAHSHSRGIIHRDIKPSNLILDAAGVVWVADFGLAKEVGQETMTATGDLVGTLRYMSPERFQGRCDERADLYALGLTLYELLTLRPAFKAGSRAEMIQLIVHQDPPGPRALEPRIPRDLETIVLHAIAKDPERRYASAEALAEDLRRFLEDEPILARRTSALVRVWRWSRRNRVLAASIACIILLVLSATVVSMVAADHFRRQRGLASQAQHLAEARRTEIQQTLYLAEMNLASAAAANGGGMGQVHELIEHWRPEITGQDLRGWEWYYLAGLRGREAVTLRLEKGRVLDLSFSPDGRRLLSTDSEGTIRVWAVDGSLCLLQVQAHDGWAAWAGWSEAGDRIATIGWDNRAVIWSAESFEREREWRVSGLVLGADWAQGRLASVGGGRLEIHETSTGALSASRELGKLPAEAAALSPDGRLVAIGLDDRVEVWQVSPEGLVPVTSLAGHQRLVDSLAWDAAGERLASGDATGAVIVWQCADWTSRRMDRSHDGPVTVLAWHGDLLASASHDQTVATWDTRSGQRLHRFEGHERRVDALAWSSDGSWIASGGRDASIKLWRWPPVDEDSALIEAGELQSVGWSPIDRRLATAGPRGVRVWEVARGAEPRLDWSSEGKSLDVHWSPDGTRLAWTDEYELVVSTVPPSSRELLRLGARCGILHAVSWSPAGDRIAAAGAKGAGIFDAETGERLQTLEGHTHVIRDVRWSPDGRRVATACLDGRVRIWEIGSPTPLVIEPGGTTGLAVAWSPDSRRIASGWNDLTVRLHDAVTGRLLAALAGHRGVVRSLAWSPDGTRLASGSDDRTVRLWDPDLCEQTLSLADNTAPVRSVAWSPDGRCLVSADAVGRIQIWDATYGFESDGAISARHR